MTRTSPKYFVTSILALACLTGGAPQNVHADNSDSISHALGVFVTPRGQKYFQDHVQDVFLNNGISLTDGAFDQWNYQANSAITIGPVRDMIRGWLLGLELNDPLLKFEADGVQYSTQFNVIALRTDATLQAQYGSSGGVVLVFDLEVPQVRVSSSKLLASDVNNPMFGDFGVNGLWISMPQTSAPLKITIPFLLQAKPSSGITVSALQVDTNIAAISLEAGFDRPLLLPKVEIIINDHTMTLDSTGVENDLMTNQKEILTSLQNYLDNIIKTQGVTTVNAMLGSFLSGGLKESSTISPPGAPAADANDPSAKYNWWVRPEAATIDSNALYFGLSGMLQDPRSKTEIPMSSAISSGSIPTATQYDPSEYDIALTLNEGFVNRIMQLNYERGYYSKITTASGSIALGQAPVFHFDTTASRDQAKLHLMIEKEVTGVETLVVNNPVKITVDANVRFITNKSGSRQMVIESIDESKGKVLIDPRSVNNIPFITGPVLSYIRGLIHQTSEGFKKTPMPLGEQIPVPSEVFGIPIKLKDIRPENGHMVFYLEYGT